MKKVFLALMAVAAIALTSCKGREAITVDAAKEYAQLCDKLVRQPQSEVNSEMDKAGWVEVDENTNIHTYVLKSKKAAYEKQNKKHSVKNYVSIGAMIHVAYNNDLCHQATLQCLYYSVENAKSTIVNFSDFAYSKGILEEFYQATIDNTDYTNRSTFLQDVKGKDWNNVSETTLKDFKDYFNVSGSKQESDGQVCYSADYMHYLSRES